MRDQLGYSQSLWVVRAERYASNLSRVVLCDTLTLFSPRHTIFENGTLRDYHITNPKRLWRSNNLQIFQTITAHGFHDYARPLLVLVVGSQPFS